MKSGSFLSNRLLDIESLTKPLTHSPLLSFLNFFLPVNRVNDKG
jgi:hypothetical protein